MKEINIDTKNLIPAPLDDKNILVDSVMDSLFDNEEYTFEKNEYLGFVNSYPTYVEHHNNLMTILLAKPINDASSKNAWASGVIEKLTLGQYKDVEIEFNEVKCQYIDESDYVVVPFIMSFTMYKSKISVRFHWNAKKNE